jgi:hypothetical protein
MNAPSAVPLHTLDKALDRARRLSAELAHKDRKACRELRVFTALTGSQAEALAAFFVWQGMGQITAEVVVR